MQILGCELHKMRLAARSRWGSYSAPPDSLSIIIGREGGGKGWEYEREGRDREREGKGRDGKGNRGSIRGREVADFDPPHLHLAPS